MKKASKIIVLLVAIASLSSFSSLHEYYISICSIDYNTESKTLEITHQFITHDLEKAVLETTGISLEIGNKNEHPKSDSLIMSYVSNYFELKTSETISLNYVGKESTLDETLWIYLESNQIEKPKEITIKNTVLTPTFEAQSNITHLNFGKRQTSFSFNRIAKTHTFTIK